MKKFLSIILCVVIVCSAFVACSKNDDKKVDTTTETTQTTQPTTDDAKIKEADAIELIKSYSAKELGLTDKQKKNCSFMVASNGVEIQDEDYIGDYYIKVIATVKNKHVDKAGKETYTFDNKGEYYISYNGKTILKKDMKSEKEKYEKLKVKPVPTTTSVKE